MQGMRPFLDAEKDCKKKTKPKKNKQNNQRNTKQTKPQNSNLIYK